MELIKKKILEHKFEAVSDYFVVDKRIGQEKIRRKIETPKTIKIAILSSFTTGGIKEVLNVKCCGLGILPEFYIGRYNQYAQEILNNNSLLCQFMPELTIVFIDIVSLLGEAFFFPYRLSANQRRSLIEEKQDTLVTLIDMLSKRTPGKIIFHNFEVPIYSPLGFLEYKQDFGFIEAIRTLNFKLFERYKDNNRVYIFDYDLFSSKYGKKNILDFKMYYLADIKIGFNLIPLLCEEYMGFIKAFMSLSRKCLVLDMDNTLWGGIIGEDGLQGIKLGPTPEGKPFLEFQKYILNLFERGIVLAVNSNNNLEDVLKVLKEHPYMLLKEEHFSCIKANWDNKVVNMKEIAKEINLGMESFVFIDDGKINREIIRKFLPEICVVDLPEDPSFYVSTLMGINEFNTLQITEEDKNRGKMYIAQRKRQRWQSSSLNISEFLKELDIKISIAKATSFTIPRISQLTQRTNQFNTTTRRYSEEEINKLVQAPNHRVYTVKVADKFGDDGICGVVISKEFQNNEKWLIDTFLLSCRVLGREIEKAVLAFIIENAKNNNVKSLVGEFIPSIKNKPAKDFYKNNGFKFFIENGAIEKWELDLVASQYQYPEFITIYNEV